jgi:hypothetical protein
MSSICQKGESAQHFLQAICRAKHNLESTTSFMTKPTKTLLILATVNLVAGLAFAANLVNVHDAVWLYVTVPAGAICLGLFLISRMLEKETALYDAEQRNVLVALNGPAEQRAPASPSGAHPTLAKAH